MPDTISRLRRGCFLRATELRVDVCVDRPSRLRQLYRHLKFHQLMHRAERVTKVRWRITIDGPLSLFDQSQKYGLQMANFLPAVLLLDDWSIEADLRWGTERKELTFKLDPEAGLTTHLKERGTYITEEEATFVKRLKDKGGDWQPKRRAKVVDLGGRDVLVPDFIVENTKTGAEVMVEIIGYWRRGYLERRAARTGSETVASRGNKPGL